MLLRLGEQSREVVGDSEDILTVQATQTPSVIAAHIWAPPVNGIVHLPLEVCEVLTCETRHQ